MTSRAACARHVPGTPRRVPGSVVCRAPYGGAARHLGTRSPRALAVPQLRRGRLAMKGTRPFNMRPPPSPLGSPTCKKPAIPGVLGHPSRCQRAASGAQRVIFPPPFGSQTSGKAWIHAA